MNALRYTFLRIRRKGLYVLLLALTFFVLTVLTARLTISASTRQQSLAQLAAATPVNGQLVSASTGRTDGLNVPALLESIVVEDIMDCGLLPLIDNLAFSDSMETTLTGETEKITVLFTNTPPEDTTIVYENGYDASVFAGNEMVCLAGEELAGWAENGVLTLDFPQNQRIVFHDATAPEEPISLQICGIVQGGGMALLAPWGAYQAITTLELRYGLQVDSFSFTVRDNTALDSVKDAIAKIQERLVKTCDAKLLLQDGLYQENTLSARKSLLLLTFLQPALSVLTAAAGAMVSTLFLRVRRREFAILRSMGQKRSAILLQNLLEVGVSCLVGLVCALPLGAGSHFGGTLVLLLCFLVGSLIPAGLYLMKPVIRQIKWEE